MRVKVSLTRFLFKHKFAFAALVILFLGTACMFLINGFYLITSSEQHFLRMGILLFALLVLFSIGILLVLFKPRLFRGKHAMLAQSIEAVPEAKEEVNTNQPVAGTRIFNEAIPDETGKTSHSFCKEVLNEMVNFANGGAAVLYTLHSGKYTLAAQYAVDEKTILKEVEVGDGTAGQALLDKKSILISHIKQPSLRIVSGLGNADPQSIIVIPFVYDDKAVAVAEIAALGDPEPDSLSQLENFSAKVAERLVNHYKTGGL